MLGRGGVLMINAGRASIGALSGSMPSGPVRIAAHPAELIDGGIAVYTSARSRTAKRAHGWNTTMYRNDARRVRDLQVLESPSAANSWRLVLRSGGKNSRLDCFDWQEYGNRKKVPRDLLEGPPKGDAITCYLSSKPFEAPVLSDCGISTMSSSAVPSLSARINGGSPS